MKPRNNNVRKLIFRSGAGIHQKSNKAKRRAANVATKNAY